VSRGDRVLIKPNLLTARAVEKHVCTHPEVVLAAAEAAQDAGPAKAITMVNKGDSRSPVAKIHPPACIHCYCCQELCPEGAIAPKRGFVRSFLRRPGHG
jgi:ferredoxin